MDAVTGCVCWMKNCKAKHTKAPGREGEMVGVVQLTGYQELHLKVFGACLWMRRADADQECDFFLNAKNKLL